MAAPYKQPWISPDRVDALVQIEPAVFVTVLALLTWLTYKLILRQVSDERHRNLRRLFRNLTANIGFGALLFFSYAIGARWGGSLFYSNHILPYIGVAALLCIAAVFIKTARIMTFICLFRSHMSVGVPLLIVNLRNR